MAYIGREPQIGNYQVCDAISVVNAQAAYTMQVNSVNVIPESVNHMIVSLNGVIQKPGSSYTISSSTITFSSNLATGDSIDFIYLLGNVLDLGTPSDDTVTAAKIVDNAINSEHYTDASIDLAHLSADSVDGSKIADNAINSEHYTDGSIDTAHIGADQITNAKIADDQIDSEHYVDGSIDTAHIADAQITLAKLAADSVNATKIADNAISEEHLDVTAITGHTAETSVADGDLVVVHDASASALRKMTVANLVANAGGGKILQVKSVTWKDAFSSTAGSGSFVNITGATLAITPAATSSKIFFQAMISTGGETYGVVLKIQRGGSDIAGALATVSGNRVASTAFSSGHSSDNAELQSTYVSYLDSPSSTSELTYTVQGAARYQPAAVAWTVNYPYDDTNASYTNHSVSTITLMEVGA